MKAHSKIISSLNYPEFHRVVSVVSSLNPLQKKRIIGHIHTQPIDFWIEAEQICKDLKSSFFQDDEMLLTSARAYNRMTTDFLKEQIRFKKTGKYLRDNAEAARVDVYENDEVMRYYMVGLCISYLLWPNHYKMYQFFKRFLATNPRVKKYLDVAPGHGLFAAQVIRKYPEVQATLVDISLTSLSVAKDLLSNFGIPELEYKAIHGDFLKIEINQESYDFISMGEVLEHVEDPLAFLRKASTLLGPNGHIFMTTCSNAPAIDHIYHFRNSEEIRSLIRESGLRIIVEECIPAENVPEELCEQERVTVNYCCILQK
jgi:2-polyprenyl-3-methyl-5-hydroxy-6-metoxy-1,4-benzoquinol methylase